MPTPPNLPHPGTQPVPGLEEQPVRGLQGLKEGAHLWGEGAGQDRDLSPPDTRPLPPPISASTLSSPAQPPRPHIPLLPSPAPAPGRSQLWGPGTLGSMAEGWDHLDAGVLPAGSPFTWPRRFICKEKTQCPEGWGQVPHYLGDFSVPTLVVTCHPAETQAAASVPSLCPAASPWGHLQGPLTARCFPSCCCSKGGCGAGPQPAPRWLLAAAQGSTSAWECARTGCTVALCPS